MITRKFFVGTCALFFSMLFSLQADQIPDWTVAVYMEAGSFDMCHWIHKNMNDMALANSNPQNVNIVAQVHIEKSEAWRYVIGQGAIKPIGPTLLNGDCGQNIVDFMRWTVQVCPAKHYGLIFWGHGFGILDPLYQSNSVSSFPWDVVADEPNHQCVNGVCPLRSADFFSDEHANHRGFMFNDVQLFVNNMKMVEAFKTIKETVLNGKNLDFVGTDCCKMAMLEVAYQIKDYVHFLVGSQNCELKDGWDYKAFFSCFDGRPLDALVVVQAIVKTYGSYYAEHTIQNMYSLSALDLSQMDSLIANHNEIVELSKKLMLKNKQIVKTAIFNARALSPSMCNASYYLDLGCVYAHWAQELDKIEPGACNAEMVDALKKLLVQGQELINLVVVANTVGSAVKNLHGISVYFPRNRIDESYLITPFGQETMWLSFLQDIIG